MGIKHTDNQSISSSTPENGWMECPECGAELRKQEGCNLCPLCGWSKCA